MADFNLLEPISSEEPCGPDLEQQDDEEFQDYYFEAESRLPERYFIPSQTGNQDQSDPRALKDRLFDPRSVRLDEETAAITALLRRSRDLRLLSLLARFQILAGRLEEFTSTVEDMAAALAQWPEDIHPQGADRRSAIEALNTQATVVMPLLHLPLLPETNVTLRRYMVVTGKATPRSSEADLEGTDFMGPLRSDAKLAALTATHGRLLRLSDAIHRLTRVAAAQATAPFHPDLAALRSAIEDMQQMIATARPELRPWQPGIVQEPAQPQGDEPVAGLVPIPQAPVGDRPVFDRATAAAALDAACNWLAVHEPSSPALVLVAQARELIGKPLVEALRILMPAEAGRALLKIGQGTPFALPMERLQALTQAGLDGQPAGENPPKPMQPIVRRADLVATLLGVEGYYTNNEPASPVPLLLAKGRDMLHARFDAIIAELLAAAPPSGEN